MVKKAKRIQTSKVKNPIALNEDASPVQNDKAPQVAVQFAGRGSSGIRNFGGYIEEEYLSALTGYQAADLYDKIRRSDSKVKKVLKAVKDPIRAASREIQAAGETPEQIQHKEFIEHVLFEDMHKDAKFPQVLNEALTFLEFGHAVFEKIHKVVHGHAVYGDYIGIKKLSWRSPRTLHKFNIDPATEELLSVTQQAHGDANRTVDMDAKFLVIMTLDREGANWVGVSGLRNCYGAWLRKQTFLKLLAIGIEKYAIPTPIGNVPVQSGPDYEAFVEALERYTSHETNYITLPKGWEIDLKDSTFDPTKVRGAVDSENMEIVDAFIANFLELAMSGGGGGRALSEDLSSFFLSGLIQIADIFADSINENVIKDLIDLNFGKQEKYPKLAFTGITDKAGTELASALKSLVDCKVIVPDDPLEENVRKRYDFPKASLKGQRQAAAPSYPGGPAFHEQSLTDRQVKLAEKGAKQIISSSAEIIKSAMCDGLTGIGHRLIEDLMKASSGLSEAAKVTAVQKVDVIGTQAYAKSLRQTLAIVANDGISSARKDVPKAKSVKLSEDAGGRRYLFDEYDIYLPSKIKKAIEAQAELLVEAQIADLKKSVLFQYTSSAASTDSMNTIEDDLFGALDKFLEGQSISVGATNTASQVINLSRREFFNEPEVAEQIEALQFVNGDPVSPICQDLAGKIFSKDDPMAGRYEPPLHHNCKSYIMPILTGNLGDRDIGDLKPSRANLDKFVTLSEKGIQFGGPGSGPRPGAGAKDSEGKAGKGKKSASPKSSTGSATSAEPSKEEGVAIRQYTGALSSQYIAADRGGATDEMVIENNKKLNSYLERAPKFQGDIHRGISVEKGDLDSVLSQYKEGSEISLDAKQSWTTDTKNVQDRLTQIRSSQTNPVSVMFEYPNSSAGVDISKHSRFEEEKEVLVPKGAKYKVKSVVQHEGGYKITFE
jgi:SPP1 gp7 family putative phage head morphogenesis protein